MRILFFFAALLVAAPASADSAMKINVCRAEAATGTCDDAAGNDIIIDARDLTSLSFDSTASDATSWSCDVYQHANTSLTVGTGGQKLNATSITQIAESLFLTGAFQMLYVSCSALDPGAGSVTISLVGHGH